MKPKFISVIHALVMLIAGTVACMSENTLYIMPGTVSSHSLKTGSTSGVTITIPKVGEPTADATVGTNNMRVSTVSKDGHGLLNSDGLDACEISLQALGVQVTHASWPNHDLSAVQTMLNRVADGRLTHVRFHFYWNQAQTERDVWNNWYFDRVSTVLDMLEAHHIEPVVVLSGVEWCCRVGTYKQYRSGSLL